MAFKPNCQTHLSNSDAVLILLSINQTLQTHDVTFLFFLCQYHVLFISFFFQIHFLTSVPSSLSIRIIQIPGSMEWYSHGATFPLCGTAMEVISPYESLPPDSFIKMGTFCSTVQIQVKGQRGFFPYSSVCVCVYMCNIYFLLQLFLTRQGKLVS